MLSPAKYWRVPCDLNIASLQSSSIFALPEQLANQASPPTRGHGITVAAYDEREQMGMLKWLGLITGVAGKNLDV